MLIQIFRKSYLLQYFFLLLLGILLWLGAFIKPISFEPNINEFLSPGYFWTISLIGNSDLLANIIAFIIIITSALLFNYTLAKNDLVPRNTLIPSMVYLVLMSHSPNLLYFHPVLVSGLLVLIVLYYIFQVYTEEEAFPQIFNAGFMLGIASLFYFPSLYFILFIWITFILYRLFKWREWFITFLGFITPYILLFTYYFWFDKLNEALLAYSDYFTHLAIFDFNFDYPVINYITITLIIFLILWSLFLLSTEIQEKIISIRKRYWTVFWLFAIASITYAFSQSFYKTHQIFILIPASIFISYAFSYITKLFWIEIIFGLMTLLIIVNNLLTAFQIL